MNVLENLEPKAVFKYFEALSRIPRGSKNEQEVSDYLVNFAKERNLEVVQDEFLNVYIKKAASAGYENAPKIVIQGHMDMVNEKNEDVVHDFLKDPLKLLIEGDFITADGTTLGADNGTAVAIGMALLDGNYTHGDLMVFITTDEEQGMSGAKSADPKRFEDYNYFLNLDSGHEGIFTVSCAGGAGHRVIIKIEETAIPDEYETFTVKIFGLNGGHSGIDIDKGLAMSNKLAAEIIKSITEKMPATISHLNGGLKTNAIPREANFVVSVAKSDVDALKTVVKENEDRLKKEYQNTEKDLTVTIENSPKATVGFSQANASAIVRNILEAPLATQTKTSRGDLESSNNIGVVTTENGEVTLFHATRSSVGALKQVIIDKVDKLAKETGAEHVLDGSYPEWEYQENSPLREKCIAVYASMYGKEPAIESTHGGLECAIFSKNMPHLDMISFGPDHYALHTPDEKVSISSTKRVFEYIIQLLESFK